MPTKTKANELTLDEVPQELSDLNSLELRLICMRIPFMKMIALPRGQQRSIHAPVENDPEIPIKLPSRDLEEGSEIALGLD